MQHDARFVHLPMEQFIMAISKRFITNKSKVNNAQQISIQEIWEITEVERDHERAAGEEEIHEGGLEPKNET